MAHAPEHKPTFAAVSVSERLNQAGPYLLVPLLIVAGFIAIGAPSSWLTLTVSGLAMGMMIFIMASGLTLVFGLMDIINFGHGAFISIGAFVGVSILFWLSAWTESPSLMLNVAAILLAIVVAMALTGVISWGFERVIIRPVYGSHLKQILISMGGLIVLEELIHLIWGEKRLFSCAPKRCAGVSPLRMPHWRNTGSSRL